MNIYLVEDEASVAETIIDVLEEDEENEVTWYRPVDSKYFDVVKAYINENIETIDAVVHDLQLDPFAPKSSKDHRICDLIFDLKDHIKPDLCWIILTGTEDEDGVSETYSKHLDRFLRKSGKWDLEIFEVLSDCHTSAT